MKVKTRARVRTRVRVGLTMRVLDEAECESEDTHLARLFVRLVHIVFRNTPQE